MRILVLNLGSLADVVQMLPAFTDLKNSYAQSVVDVIVDERWAEVPHWHPAVGKVFTVPMQRWRQSLFSLSMVSSEEAKRLRRQLRKFNYDWVIDLHGGWLSASFARSIHCPSAGFSSCNQKKRASSMLYSYRHPEEKQLHRVEQVRRLFSGCLSYSPKNNTLPDYGLACCNFATSAKGDAICLMLGARSSRVRMPLKEARQLIGLLAERRYHVRLVWRDRNSGDYVRSVAEGTQADLMPKLKLSGIASVLVDAKAVISVDNELSHIAAALKTPMIRLQSDAKSRFTTAYAGNQSVVTNNDQGQWSPQLVIDKLQNLLEKDSTLFSSSFDQPTASIASGIHHSPL